MIMPIWTGTKWGYKIQDTSIKARIDMAKKKLRSVNRKLDKLETEQQNLIDFIKLLS